MFVSAHKLRRNSCRGFDRPRHSVLDLDHGGRIRPESQSSKKRYVDPLVTNQRPDDLQLEQVVRGFRGYVGRDEGEDALMEKSFHSKSWDDLIPAQLADT